LKMPDSSMVWVSSLSPVAAYSYGMHVEFTLPTREAFFFSLFVQVSILIVASIFLFKKKLYYGKSLKNSL